MESIYTKSQIAEEEAIEIIRLVIGKSLVASVSHTGVIKLEIGEIKTMNIVLSTGQTIKKPRGEYSIVIEDGWVISSLNKQYYYQNFLSLRDEPIVEKFIGDTKIIGLNIVQDFGIMSFALANQREINFTNGRQPVRLKFKMFINNDPAKNSSLYATSDNKFYLVPLEDKVAKK